VGVNPDTAPDITARRPAQNPAYGGGQYPYTGVLYGPVCLWQTRVHPICRALATVLAAEAATAKRRTRRGAQPEIVGGRPVPQGTFPFMAFLGIDLGGGQGISCGGSVIAPTFVLTAAHCTGPDGGHDPPFAPSAYTVDIGQVHLDRLAPENRFGVVAVQRHPGWDPDTNQAFDVAVLQLDRPIPATLTAPLAFVGAGEARFDAAGQPVVVAGWGTTASGGFASSILLQADLAVVSDADCAASYGADFDAASMICAAAPGRDSCQGDSGGPLFANAIIGFTTKRKKRKKKRIPIFAQTQVGIVSFGQGCADPGFAGVYARVSDPAINAFITGAIG
jgi:secreted trypsin-like serine protease